MSYLIIWTEYKGCEVFEAVELTKKLRQAAFEGACQIVYMPNITGAKSVVDRRWEDVPSVNQLIDEVKDLQEDNS